MELFPMSDKNVKTFMFEDDGSIPNNPDLPMIVYQGALPENSVAAARQMFQEHQWGGTWVNGIFSYHHYHSTAHEALAVVRGSADVQFGGPQGQRLKVKAGDIVVLPAGTGHCNKGASSDFTVVGAYPRGQNWDMNTGEPDERPEVLENIRNVPLPKEDP